MKKQHGYVNLDGVFESVFIVGLVAGAALGIGLWEFAQWAWPYMRAFLLWVLQ